MRRWIVAAVISSTGIFAACSFQSKKDSKSAKTAAQAQPAKNERSHASLALGGGALPDPFALTCFGQRQLCRENVAQVVDTEKEHCDWFLENQVILPEQLEACYDDANAYGENLDAGCEEDFQDCEDFAATYPAGNLCSCQLFDNQCFDYMLPGQIEDINIDGNPCTCVAAESAQREEGIMQCLPFNPDTPNPYTGPTPEPMPPCPLQPEYNPAGQGNPPNYLPGSPDCGNWDPDLPLGPPSPSPDPSISASPSTSPTPTATASYTPTSSPTPTATPSSTATGSWTPTPTATPSSTAIGSWTPTPTATPSSTATGSWTPTPS